MLTLLSVALSALITFEVTRYFYSLDREESEIRSLRLSLLSAKLSREIDDSYRKVRNNPRIPDDIGRARLILDPDLHWVFDRCPKCGRKTSLYKDLWKSDIFGRNAEVYYLGCNDCDFEAFLGSLVQHAETIHPSERELIHLLREKNIKERRDRGRSGDVVWVHKDWSLFSKIDMFDKHEAISESFPQQEDAGFHMQKFLEIAPYKDHFNLSLGYYHIFFYQSQNFRFLMKGIQSGNCKIEEVTMISDWRTVTSSYTSHRIIDS